MTYTQSISQVKGNANEIKVQKTLIVAGAEWLNKKEKSLNKTKPANFGEGAGFESITGFIMTHTAQKSNRGNV
ncbi:hypothetical protein JL49_13420 [Pseudoalteromonas luteoviolacea]|nr:hypothetical protein JL49_13420 [Pseudoalteromonas luteoviolacea]